MISRSGDKEDISNSSTDPVFQINLYSSDTQQLYAGFPTLMKALGELATFNLNNQDPTIFAERHREILQLVGYGRKFVEEFGYRMIAISLQSTQIRVLFNEAIQQLNDLVRAYCKDQNIPYFRK